VIEIKKMLNAFIRTLRQSTNRLQLITIR
jgi:hypothetical protein